MRSRSGPVFVAVFVVLGMLAGEAHAREGRVPIGAGTPYVIANPGHYILTSNMTLSSGPAIIVTSDCVELNLNGKSIVHSGNAAGDNLIEIANPHTDVTIHNGWLTGGHRGINFAGVNPTQVRIRDVEIRGAEDRGISISPAESAELESNQVHEILGPYGIYVAGAGPSFTFTGRFVENTVQDVFGWGIYLQGLEGGDVIRNIVRRSARGTNGSGIELRSLPALGGGNLLIENTVSSCGSGLVIGSRNNQIEDNVIYDNQFFGLRIGGADGNKIRNNVIGKNGDDGLNLSIFTDRNVIEGNQIEGNSGWGINFNSGGSSGNFCRDNAVQSNNNGASSLPIQVNLGGNVPPNLCQ